MLLLLPEITSVVILTVGTVVWREGTEHNKTRHDGTNMELQWPRGVPTGVHSLGSLGAPKQGQLITGKVGIQKGEALQDTVHQALH